MKKLRLALTILAFAFLSGCNGGALNNAGPPPFQSIPESIHRAPNALGVPQAVLSPTSGGAGLFTLSNPGTATLNISSISAGPCGGLGGFRWCFHATSNCGAQLVASKSCTIDVTFSSFGVTGSFTGTLSVYDNASGSPQTATLHARVPCVGYGGQCTSTRQCCPGLKCIPASTRAFCEPATAQTGQLYLNRARRDTSWTYRDPLVNTDFVSVIDTKKDAVVRTIAVGTGAVALAITPDGKTIYVADAPADSVFVVDTQRNAVVKTIAVGFGERPTDVAVTANGKFAVISNAQGRLSILDTATNTVTRTMPSSFVPTGGALLRRCSPGIVASPDGATAYVVANQDGIVPTNDAHDDDVGVVALL